MSTKTAIQRDIKAAIVATSNARVRSVTKRAKEKFCTGDY
jgi:hypothetical protein